MFNAASKYAAIAALILSAASCTSEADRREHAAEELRSQAAALVEQRDFEQAIALLDSLDSAYRDRTAVRRAGLAVRAAAIEGLSISRIEPAEKRLALAQLAVDSLGALFTRIDAPRGLDGYSVARELAKQEVTAATGVQPRIDDDGYLSIAAVVKGRGIGLNSISVTTQNGTVQSEPQSPDRLIVSEGAELASFRQEEVTHVLEALQAAGDGPAKLHLNGTGGTTEVKLTPALRAALVRSLQYAMARQELRAAALERERLERTLQTARDHKANAPLPSQE
ncbi:MAG: hypothetical protein K2L99_02825 [Muribaculaceae bacterium]|nr:hypothetical protein [Muribaculaceae bacterium]